MIRAAAILLLLTASAQAGDPYAGCGARRYQAMQNDMACVRTYRDHRYFPVLIQTRDGVAVIGCWPGQWVEIDGQPWCRIPPNYRG